MSGDVHEWEISQIHSGNLSLTHTPNIKEGSDSVNKVT